MVNYDSTTGDDPATDKEGFLKEEGTLGKESEDGGPQQGNVMGNPGVSR